MNKVMHGPLRVSPDSPHITIGTLSVRSCPYRAAEDPTPLARYLPCDARHVWSPIPWGIANLSTTPASRTVLTPGAMTLSQTGLEAVSGDNTLPAAEALLLIADFLTGTKAAQAAVQQRLGAPARLPSLTSSPPPPPPPPGSSLTQPRASCAHADSFNAMEPGPEPGNPKGERPILGGQGQGVYPAAAARTARRQALNLSPGDHLPPPPSFPHTSRAEQRGKGAPGPPHRDVTHAGH